MTFTTSVYGALSKKGEQVKVSTTVWLEEPLLQRIKKESELTGFTVSSILNEMVRLFFQEADRIIEDEVALHFSKTSVKDDDHTDCDG